MLRSCLIDTAVWSMFSFMLFAILDYEMLTRSEILAVLDSVRFSRCNDPVSLLTFGLTPPFFLSITRLRYEHRDSAFVSFYSGDSSNAS